MATRGRKPLPTAIKLLEGDRGKGRRLAHHGRGESRGKSAAFHGYIVGYAVDSDLVVAHFISLLERLSM